MENQQVNNIYKIKDKEVNYFEVFGEKVQFDEMFELTVDLDEKDRNYNKMKLIYQDGRQPMILTIQEIYDGMMEDKWEGRHPQLPEVKGYNSYIDKNSIRMSKGIYTPKVLLFLADELNELMTSDDYQSVDKVKGALGSIARLGRAAAVHLALACQRASGSTISSDLKNNIQMSVLLGGFDEGASQLMFEKDISNLAKPDIKGRGFIGSGNEIIETQTYFTQPENDWVFDDKQKLSYNNPVYLEQCKRKGITIDDSGWVKQHPLDEEVEEEEIIEEEIEGTNDNDFNDNSSDDSKINQDIDDLFKKPDKETSKEETPKKSIDDIKMSDDMDDLFSNPFGEQSSTRKKVEDALDIAEPNTNNIKLNIDNTYSEAPSTKLKLHINKKK